MDHFWKVLALSVGGVLGVNARYWLGHWMNRWASPTFPWATLTINVTGSFAIGFLAVALARPLPNSNLRLLLVTGLLGGYTTFSAFSLETLSMWERGDRRNAVAYVLGSLIAGLLAVVMGAGIARYFSLEASRQDVGIANVPGPGEEGYV